MANIRVDIQQNTIKDGSELVFLAPCDCSEISGLSVYYRNDNGDEENKSFNFVDAHGSNLKDVDNLFKQGAYVKVILSVTKGIAYIQNADTNAYLEAKFDMLNSQLTSDNGKSFRFGFNQETEEYGYWIAESGGADTFHPFSNAKDLYEALKYSGLVDEDMTFDDMCEQLKKYFPEEEILVDYGNVTEEYDSVSIYEIGTAIYGDEKLSAYFEANNGLVVHLPCHSENYENRHNVVVFDKPIDVTKFATMKFIINTDTVGNPTSHNRTLKIGVATSKNNTSLVVYKEIPYPAYNTNNGVYTIDVSELIGQVYFKIVHTQHGFSTDMSISDIRFLGEDIDTVLIAKEINRNGTYIASDDNADGYYRVVVNVPTGGSSEQYDALWDAIQYKGKRTSYPYTFKYFDNETFKPKYPIKLDGDNTDMFDDSYITSLEGIDINFSGCTIANGIFKESEFVTLPILDFSSAISMNDIFLRCQYLERIEKLILGDKLETYNNAFGSTPVLSHLIIEGTIKRSISFVDSPLLDAESVQSIIDALADYSGGIPAPITDAVSFNMNENYNKYAVDTLFTATGTEVYNATLGTSAYGSCGKIVSKGNVIPGSPSNERVLELAYRPGASHEVDFRVSFKEGYRHLLGDKATDQDLVYELDFAIGGWSEKKNGFVIRIDQAGGNKSIARFLVTSDYKNAYISVYSDSSHTINPVTLSRGQFHKLKVIIHKKEKRYSYYIDDVKIGDSISAMWTDFDNIGTIGFFIKKEDYTSTDDARCMMWIDNINVYVQDKAVELAGKPKVTFHSDIMLSDEQLEQIETKGWEF